VARPPELPDASSLVAKPPWAGTNTPGPARCSRQPLEHRGRGKSFVGAAPDGEARPRSSEYDTKSSLDRGQFPVRTAARSASVQPLWIVERSTTSVTGCRGGKATGRSRSTASALTRTAAPGSRSERRPSPTCAGRASPSCSSNMRLTRILRSPPSRRTSLSRARPRGRRRRADAPWLAQRRISRRTNSNSSRSRSPASRP
jgi:hypothetical protein